MAGREALEAEHPHAAAGEPIERRAAGGAEPTDDDIEMSHIASLHHDAVLFLHFLRCRVFGRNAEFHPRLREGGHVPENAPVKVPRVKLTYAEVLFAIILVAAAGGLAAAQGVPLPRPRPLPPAAAVSSDEPSAPEAAPPTACRLRLTAALATAPSLPPITGPGECGAPDVVRLEAVVLPDQSRVAIAPPAILRCSMAEAIVSWVREEAAPHALELGSSLKTLANLASFDCRGRNRIVGAKLSEHGKGNALDIHLLKLSDGKVVGLTDPQIPRDFREGLRQSVCARFTTVLGPGSDGYHEDHVHVDLAERRNGYRICEWDVREPAEASSAVLADTVPLPRPRPLAAR